MWLTLEKIYIYFRSDKTYYCPIAQIENIVFNIYYHFFSLLYLNLVSDLAQSDQERSGETTNESETVSFSFFRIKACHVRCRYKYWSYEVNVEKLPTYRGTVITFVIKVKALVYEAKLKLVRMYLPNHGRLGHNLFSCCILLVLSSSLFLI